MITVTQPSIMLRLLPTYNNLIEVKKCIYLKTNTSIFYDSINTLAYSYRADSATFLTPLLALVFMVYLFSPSAFNLAFHVFKLQEHLDFYLFLVIILLLLFKVFNLYPSVLRAFQSDLCSFGTHNMLFLTLAVESKSASTGVDRKY